MPLLLVAHHAHTSRASFAAQLHLAPHTPPPQPRSWHSSSALYYIPSFRCCAVFRAARGRQNISSSSSSSPSHQSHHNPSSSPPLSLRHRDHGNHTSCQPIAWHRRVHSTLPKSSRATRKIAHGLSTSSPPLDSTLRAAFALTHSCDVFRFQKTKKLTRRNLGKHARPFFSHGLSAPRSTVLPVLDSSGLQINTYGTRHRPRLAPALLTFFARSQPPTSVPEPDRHIYIVTVAVTRTG